ncbi:protein kinase domain-containing protein [Carboxylicivirga caseinilyticus]|uniref:protein kinase domain-containing protein n=1 Tax=Carboxylicivirga caseinilyticus TaxID=3417572 RepID=UPI003D3254CA|nr:protein kinase [Marinilabiliaceae bacterium A049]
MYDLRESNKIDLTDADCLKEETTYKFKDSVTGKDLIAKFISYYSDEEDIYLKTEFKKLALLSGEPEIGTVYYIATGILQDKPKSCYIMDFVKGKTLGLFLEERNSIIYEVAYDIIIQIASGLEKAHNFEVFHSDLHNENIIIDNLGYIKLIDFLWWDVNLPAEQNLAKDLEDFKRISKELTSKCKNGQDLQRFQLLDKYCQGISTFNGLKKELELIDIITFDISLLESKDLDILSCLFAQMEDTYTLHMQLGEKHFNIPAKYILPLTTQEEEYYKKNQDKLNPLKIRYSDSREERIENALRNTFDLKLNALKHSNLLTWNIWVTNEGEEFEGPYFLNYYIRFTSKFYRWMKINELIPFTNESHDEFERLILE